MEISFWKNRHVSMTASTRIWHTIMVLGFIVILGTIFRLDHLDSRTMGHIEVYAPNIELPEEISDPLPRLTLWRTLKGSMFEPHPPAWYISMWPYTKLFGTGLFIIRLPSVIFGVASILLIYVLGTLAENRLTALLGAGLLAFNGHHIFWSQIARPYSMACFLGLLSTVLLLLARRKGNPQRVFLWLYLVITLYGLSTTYYFWLLFAIQIFWVLLNSFVKKTVMFGLIRSQLFSVILASPLVTLAMFQSRQSYLGSKFLLFLREFLQFGFLFEPDYINDLQNPLSTIERFSLPFLALLLLIMGLVAKRRWDIESNSNDISGPSLKQLALITAFAFICIMFAAKILIDVKPSKTYRILASGIIPLLIFLLIFLFHRYSANVHKIGVFLIKRKWLRGVPYALISFLAILPIIIIGVISLFIPFFASRHILIFTPYLLITLSRGIVYISNKMRRFSLILFTAIVLFLVNSHYSSIEYYKNRLSSPNDYKGLAKDWIPHIKNSDLIFVQPHYATTPIFYYLKADRYHFVGQNYTQEIRKFPESRVWVLSFEGIPPTKEMMANLVDYEPLMSIDALRIKAELYIRDQ